MAPRAGSEAAARLARLPDCPGLWESIEGKYEEMLVAKGDDKLKKLDATLEAMGARLRDVEMNNDTAPFISKKELVQVMTWKMSKGKWRPLMKHIEKNLEKEVKTCSSGSFALVQEGDIRGAVKEMARLNGVGPATASAILSLYRPDLFAFMSDEVIDSLHSGKRDYTLPIYLNVNKKCTDLAAALGDDWTPRRVGKIMWTAARVLATGGKDFTADVARKEGNKRSTDSGRTGPAKSKRRRKGSK